MRVQCCLTLQNSPRLHTCCPPCLESPNGARDEDLPSFLAYLSKSLGPIGKTGRDEGIDNAKEAILLRDVLPELIEGFQEFQVSQDQIRRWQV